jgi:hypothetical protein
MPDRPLLILPTSGPPIGRKKKKSFGKPPHYPSKDRQIGRIAPRLESIQGRFEARVRTEATGTIPEEVVVLETIGSVEGFIGVASRISGLEWLGEIEEEEIPPDDDFFVPNKLGEATEGKMLRGRLFLVFSNQQGLREILRLWHTWEENRRLDKGLRKWEHIFKQLKDVRLWGVKDRLEETGVLDDWRARIENNEEVVPCEIELWFRDDPNQRVEARNRVVSFVEDSEGILVAETLIEEIRYQALLVQLPIASVQTLLETGTRALKLVQCEQVQYFRTAGQAAGVLYEDETTSDSLPIYDSGLPLGEPVVALFDGLPVQNHRRLDGRLIVDDPDGYEAEYEARYRQHGTAMASLILHGDLESRERPLARKIYVRPVLQPDARGEETARDDVLFIDLIHRSVRRLFETETGEEPAAPEICIINFSIGIRDRLFDNSLSPLARLLDWLAWKYQVLFLISAGNHQGSLICDVPRSRIHQLTPQELQEAVIKAVASDARNRRLLSPAESVNGLTVAGIHKDGSTGAGVPNSIDPFENDSLPSIINAQGMGYRRAIKPDMLAPGGKVVILEAPQQGNHATFDIYKLSRQPGQCAAAPDIAGDLDKTCYIRGTSCATAIASRAASHVFEALEELRDGPGGDLIDTVPYAVWIKTLLTHSAGWGSSAGTLREILLTPENSRKFKEYLTRLLGFGAIDPRRVSECTSYRVTALGGGTLRDNEAHIHRFPLPPSLSGQRCLRTLVVTLGWMTPINTKHQAWRRAHLSFDPPKDPLLIERQEADHQAVKRGTIQHEVMEGQRAAAFIEGQELEIQVNCRADAGVLEDSVPYALATALEVPQEIGIDIYSEISIQVQAARVAVTASE